MSDTNSTLSCVMLVLNNKGKISYLVERRIEDLVVWKLELGMHKRA